MKNQLVFALVLTALTTGIPRGWADAPEDLSSTITTVTVYSDRAQVTREARVELKKQPVTYAFRKLPGWVDDATVRASMAEDTAGRIIDVQVQRDYLAQSSDETYRKAEAAVTELMDQITAIDDQLQVLDARRVHIQSIQVFSLEKMPKEAAVRDVDVTEYRKVIDFISSGLQEVNREKRSLEAKRRDLLPELDVRQRKLAALQNLTQLEETTVLVTVQGDHSGSSKLFLSYLLPGATWEPVHELRVQGSNTDKVELASYAIVAQTSGEDWSDAALRFSTQSSTESARIPQLEALKIGSSEAAARLVQERTESFNRAKNAFEVQNRIWNEVKGGKGNKMEVYDNNFLQLQTTQTRAEQTFLQLKTRGTSAHFKGVGVTTVRTDGHQVRIPIGHTTLAATRKIVAVPEQTLNAVSTLEMTNQGSQPLLPGPVALFQGASFLGNTDLDFVAEGEQFAMFLGVEDRVKLSRVLDRKHSKVNRDKTTRMNVNWVVSVENLTDESITLDLADHIPISENSRIEVDDIEVSGDKEPDSKGMLQWHLTLKPREKKSFSIKYRVEYPTELVRQMKQLRRVQDQQQMDSSILMPSSSSKVYDFEEQIINLDEAF